MLVVSDLILELYKVTKNPLYLSVVEKTMNHIINEEINVAGSGSAFECWYGGKALQTYPTYHTMETCFNPWLPGCPISCSLGILSACTIITI